MPLPLYAGLPRASSRDAVLRKSPSALQWRRQSAPGSTAPEQEDAPRQGLARGVDPGRLRRVFGVVGYGGDLA